MGKIILVCGGNNRAVESYTSRSLIHLEPGSPAPFWVDLVSPSERLLHRISIPFGFDAHAVKACLAYHLRPSCDDFGDYLFIKTCLLEPSKKKLFIQRDVKIFLNGDYLITVHRSGVPLHRRVPGFDASAFTGTIALLLRIFDESILTLIRSFPSEETSKNIFADTGDEPSRNPSWWKLRNFRTALLRCFHFLDELAFVGARFFEPEDKSALGSITMKVCLLLDVVGGGSDRSDPRAKVLSSIEKGKPA